MSSPKKTHLQNLAKQAATKKEILESKKQLGIANIKLMLLKGKKAQLEKDEKDGV